MSRGATILITTALLLLTGVLLVVFAFRIGSAPTDQDFVVGSARRLADSVPLLFQDLQGGDLDIWVHRVDGKWKAFSAHTGQRDCPVEWRRARKLFVDCNGAVYPPDGGDLEQFTTRVDSDGRVVVDFGR